ncbi:MAG: UPF0175 family protein [Firmicutes bacterium]|nr:UPF0175 family protein [Bacillota bacterium]
MEKIKIEIDIPQDVIISVNKSTKEFSEDIKKVMAVELYSTSKLSLGKSARLAGLCKEDFIKYLSDKGKSLFNWDEEELETEIQTIEKLLKE